MKTIPRHAYAVLLINAVVNRLMFVCLFVFRVRNEPNPKGRLSPEEGGGGGGGGGQKHPSPPP